MPLQAIKPNNYLILRFPVPPNNRVEYEVEASSPVTTFVVDDEGLREYKSRGDTITSYYGGFSRRYLHKEKVRFPREMGGDWYLIISNDSKKDPAAVRFEVFE